MCSSEGLPTRMAPCRSTFNLSEVRVSILKCGWRTGPTLFHLPFQLFTCEPRGPRDSLGVDFIDELDEVPVEWDFGAVHG